MHLRIVTGSASLETLETLEAVTFTFAPMEQYRRQCGLFCVCVRVRVTLQKRPIAAYCRRPTIETKETYYMTAPFHHEIASHRLTCGMRDAEKRKDTMSLQTLLPRLHVRRIRTVKGRGRRHSRGLSRRLQLTITLDTTTALP